MLRFYLIVYFRLFRMSRRSSWTEVENPEGPNYFYDDPDLGGSGETQWENPLSEDDFSGDESALGLQSACNSVQLKRFMKSRVGNSEVTKAARDRTSRQQASIRAQRISQLRRLKYGEELASNYRYKKFDTAEGEVYYTSVVTGETTWDLPQGAVVVNGGNTAEAEAEGDGEGNEEEFEEALTEDGEVFYVGRRKGNSVWELPKNGVVVSTIN